MCYATSPKGVHVEVLLRRGGNSNTLDTVLVASAKGTYAWGCPASYSAKHKRAMANSHDVLTGSTLTIIILHITFIGHTLGSSSHPESIYRNTRAPSASLPSIQSKDPA